MTTGKLSSTEKDSIRDYYQTLIDNGLNAALALDVITRIHGPESASLLDARGDTPEKPPTRLEKRFKRYTDTITDAAPDGDDIAFMHTVLCQLGLPRSLTSEWRQIRQSGNVGISIEAGYLWDGTQFVDQPLPYGPLPRLILAQLNSEALRQRSSEVAVGPSASAFLRTLGINPAGGARGSFTMFKKQVQALAACRVTLGYSVGERAYTLKGDLIEGFEAWTTASSGCREMWPEVIRFSQRYYDNLTEHAVPIDMRALHALRGSALSLDIYLMLSERLHRISGSYTILRWHQLHGQFGTEYVGDSGIKNFKRDFKKALKNVLTVYPTAKVEVVNTGVRIKPSPPPVPYTKPLRSRPSPQVSANTETS